jgi:hypothetical protein
VAKISAPYTKSVFINCPFDKSWQDKFRAIVFTILACEFKPRCSFEQDDTGDVRIHKIMEIIEQCKYSIHDLSQENARMNMPLELGLYIGCRQYNPDKKHRDKKYLVFEGKDYNLKKSLSDLSGQDVKTHNDDISAIIQGVRDWLDDKIPKRKGGLIFPHAPYLKTQFDQFANSLPALCLKLNWSEDRLTYADYLSLASPWITAKIISTLPRHP